MESITKKEPSNFFLDEKDGKYYSNLFKNNCMMSIKYYKKMLSQLSSLNNTLDQLCELTIAHNPYSDHKSELGSIKKDIESINNTLTCVLQKCQEELNEINQIDFQKLLNQNEKNIQKIEKEKHN